MRITSIWSLYWALSLAARTTADEAEPPDFPVTINIGVVFPRNDSTYNNDLTSVPAIFAIENARALFWFGWTTRFDIERVNKTGGTSGRYNWGQISYPRTEAPLPPGAIGEDWVVGNSSWSDKPKEPEPGPYRLRWSLTKSYCTQEPNRLVIQPAIPLLEGAVDFDFVDDGSGEALNLTTGCPVYQSSRLIRGSSFDNTGACMFISDEQPDETPDLCHLRLDQTMADCVMSNITKGQDRSACEAWARRRDREGEGSGGDGDDSEPGSDSKEEGGASAPGVRSALVATVVLSSFGFVLV
ncbi:hypothetical protein ACJ41O_001453 [Fusarium nematophilum]